MAHLTPSLQQQSEQHSNPLRNARCSGLTVRAKQVFRVEGSYTANLWAGMPASTSWAIRWMLGIVGSWSIPASLCLLCGQEQHPQTLAHPCTMEGRLHGASSHYQPSPWPAQGALAGGQGCCQPYSFPAELSQQIHLCSCPSTALPMCHLPCATCPVLWPKLSSCLIPALNHSFTLCGRKETAHCQISYLKGNLATFIEPLSWSLAVTGGPCDQQAVLRHGDHPSGVPGRRKAPLIPQTREPLIQRQAGLQGKARASQSLVCWQSTAKLVAGY